MTRSRGCSWSVGRFLVPGAIGLVLTLLFAFTGAREDVCTLPPTGGKLGLGGVLASTTRIRALHMTGLSARTEADHQFPSRDASCTALEASMGYIPLEAWAVNDGASMWSKPIGFA